MLGHLGTVSSLTRQHLDLPSGRALADSHIYSLSPFLPCPTFVQSKRTCTLVPFISFIGTLAATLRRVILAASPGFGVDVRESAVSDVTPLPGEEPRSCCFLAVLSWPRCRCVAQHAPTCVTDATHVV